MDAIHIADELMTLDKSDTPKEIKAKRKADKMRQFQGKADKAMKARQEKSTPVSAPPKEFFEAKRKADNMIILQEEVSAPPNEFLEAKRKTDNMRIL